MDERRVAAYAAGFTTAVAAGAFAARCYLVRRHTISTWRATADEVSRELPGDDLRPDADVITTRAIGISAPPDCVWPWLAQIGSGRGGGYSYDWIENLFGLDMHSAQVILPQSQNIQPGDEFPFGRHGVMRVAAVQPDHALVLCFFGGNWIWTFALYRLPETTRLVSRNRITFPHKSAPAVLFRAPIIELGGLLLERKMLLGIKERAERLADGQAP
ncbi:MAG TPA: hypothetical protein VEV63_14260 [Streptosporangiaceae bacterium]|nr:hypothetical protein [Streptosporangiaceae bacterium]